MTLRRVIPGLLRKSEGGGFVGCSGAFNPSITGLLDSYPGANLAWSLRRLRDGYNGPCIRVGHIGDALIQQDICFDNNIIDIAQVNAFSATSSTGLGCYVSRIYLQDLTGGYIEFGTSSGTFPAITDASNTVFTYNGLPSLKVAIGLQNIDPLIGIVGASLFSVVKLDAITSPIHYLTWQSTGNIGGVFLGGASASVTGRGFTAANTIKMQGGGEGFLQHLQTYIGGSVKKLYQDGAEIADAVDKTYTDPNIEFIGRPGSYSVNGYLSEIISYPSEQSSNRAGIEANINAYYSIY